MKVTKVILENFRSYRERTEIDLDNFTCIIGKNDAGKSTILEALDIFFKGDVIKIDEHDANKGGNPKNVLIGVCFSNLPTSVVLDSNADTTLQDEFLLNENSELEIHKIFDCTKSSIKPEIFSKAIHPANIEGGSLLAQTQAKLKQIIRSKNLEDHANLNSNPSMRSAIYNATPDLELEEQLVPLNKENSKAVFDRLETYFPIFALFQSDRPSKDQDPEVQNPMKLAVEQALSGLEAQLDEILEKIQSEAQATANRTLEKLSEHYPEVASSLNPKFKKPNWRNLFKLDLEGDDGIPVNKRGSGVRRLILLSFFQAEADKKRTNLEDGRQRSIFYAIEEPENSQHPSNQIRIIEALQELAKAGDQVLVTTHVPALASRMPLDSLRYIDPLSEDSYAKVKSGMDDESVFAEIAEALGVYPDALDKVGVKVAVLVEGKTDIDAIRSMVEVFEASGKVAPLDDSKIFWTIGGGDTTLMDWVERKYLDRLNIPQIMLQDSDRESCDAEIHGKRLNGSMK